MREIRFVHSSRDLKGDGTRSVQYRLFAFDGDRATRGGGCRALIMVTSSRCRPANTARSSGPESRRLGGALLSAGFDRACSSLSCPRTSVPPSSLCCPSFSPHTSVNSERLTPGAPDGALKMDDTTMMEEEDTKRFDSVHGGNDEDNQPDPDEALMMDSGNGRVWLVKVRVYVF